MPATKSAMRRYRIIDKAINNKYKPYPTKDELLDLLSEKVGHVSESTLDKDLYDMRYDEDLGFNAPIQFSKKHKGYYYAEPGYSIMNFPVSDEDMEAIKFAADTLEQYSNIPLFRQFRDAIQKINEKLKISDMAGEDEIFKIVQFEHSESPSGVDWLSTALAAIQKKQTVTFEYENIYKDKIAEYTVHPYLLKEYRNRWYLIAWSPERSDYLTFGLDRVRNLKVLRDSYKRRKDFDPDRFFRHSIGITEFDHQPQNIILEFDPVIGKLIKAQPLHSSQKIISDTKKGLMVSIHVLITEELIQTILAWGSKVRVDKPASLKEEIMSRLMEALRKYD